MSMSRRRFLQAGAAGVMAGSVLGPRNAGAQAGRTAGGGAARSVSLDAGWRFGGPLVPGSTEPGFDDSAFELVTLPHTVTELSWRRWDPSSWEREWIYRRHFDVPHELRGLRVFADFGAAMTKAAVTLNGRALGEHSGGYLPFGYELTDRLQARDNVLAVALDSRFNLNVPPNRPGSVATTSVDFWQPGGLYRPVTLRGVPQAFVADVFARPADVLDAGRRVEVECTIDSAAPLDATVRVELLRDGRRVVADSAPVTLAEPGRSTVALRLERLGGIALWDLDDPNLYDVVTTLELGGRPVHDHATRIGFRDARFTTDGFFLNGERVQIFGVNRHQFFPFAGGAMPARVQRHDAEIIRRTLRCNFVRCSHYPQAEAFYDACDELGLLAWEEAAGWGAYIGDLQWQDRAVSDVGSMVLRDRNHASIVIWGARLNETEDDVELWTRTRDLAHSLDPSRQTTGAMAGRHDTPNFVQDVFSQNDYSKKDGQPSLQPPRTDRPYLVSEAIGTLNGPAIYYRRTDPVAAQQGQARAHAQVHELASTDRRYCGLIAWSGFDYPSGSGNQWQGIKYTGVVDLFREPKPGAAIYRAQVDPAHEPVIEPAFYWDFGPQSPASGPGADAMICSNCERLELFVGGERFASVEPDRARFGHLRFPPSFVDLTVDGSGRPELRIDGYVGDRRVLSRRFSSDPSGDRLQVRADDDALFADGSDATRVAFRAVDRYGAARPYVRGDVLVDVDGPATLVGDSPFAFEDAGGVGAVWLRSRPNEPGIARVRVTHGELGHGDAILALRPVAPGGRPGPDATLSASAAPALVRPGATARVTAQLTNTGRPALRDVTLALPAPAGWSAEARTTTRFAAVAPGQAVEAAWDVRAPADAAPGSIVLAAQAAFEAAGVRAGERDEVALVVPTALEQAFDNVAVTSDDDFAGGNLDGVGNTYSRQALAAAGLTSGQAFTHDGIAFTWPGEREGEPDNALADGQTIALEAAGTVLGVVGCTSRGPIARTGTLHFADGTATEYALTLDDYFSAPRPVSGNESVAQLPYINCNGPKADNGVGGTRTQVVYVFYVAVPIPEGKGLIGVTLPHVGDSVAGGPPAMHIFALGVS